MANINYQVTTKRTNEYGYIELPDDCIPFGFKIVMVESKEVLQVDYLKVVKKRKKKRAKK